MNKQFTKTFICSLLAVIMFACADSSDSFKLLTDADRLMESNTDSALTLLNRIDTAADLREDGRKALYYLLLTQAQHKCYHPTTADSMLDFSLKHYQAIKDEEKLARTYYYMGIIAYHRKQYEISISQLKSGLKVANKLDNDELKSKYYESLCEINEDCGYWDLSLLYGKELLAHALKMRDTGTVVRSYSYLYYIYKKMNNLDSADVYCRRQIPLSDYFYDKSSSLTNIGCMYLRHGDLDSAKLYLTQSLNIKWRHNTAAALSDIYLREGNLAEATNMRDKALKTANPELKKEILTVYADFLAKSGNNQKAHETYRQVIQISDSLRSAEKKNTIAELQMKYDNKEAEHRRETAEMRLWIILSLSLAGLFGFISAIMILIRYYKRIIKRMKRLTKKIRREYVSVLEEKQEQMDKISETIKELEKDRAKNEKAIHKLHKKMADIKQNLCMRLGRGRNIFNKIKNGMEVFLKKNDERSYLIDYYSIREYKTFYRWNMKYAKLTSGLLVFLILSDMGIGDDRIMEILGISDTTIRANRSKLKKQEKGNTGEDWEELEKLEELENMEGLDGLEEQEDLEVEPC